MVSSKILTATLPFFAFVVVNAGLCRPSTTTTAEYEVTSSTIADSSSVASTETSTATTSVMSSLTETSSTFITTTTTESTQQASMTSMETTTSLAAPLGLLPCTSDVDCFIPGDFFCGAGRCLCEPDGVCR